MVRPAVMALLALFFSVNQLWAAGDDLEVNPFAVAPFALLLLGIALLPIFAGHFWHSNLRKLIVSVVLSGPVIAYLFWLDYVEHQPALIRLEHALLEFADFIVLLGALYTVAGGVVVQGYLRPSVLTNTAILAIGGVLANFVGTTGASMLLIRPFLRINVGRQHRRHLPVFFIFVVSNLGGLLTPLGDPPLFLGFLRGVDFFWTLTLTPHWLVVMVYTLIVFAVWDSLALRRESPERAAEGASYESRISVKGTYNFLFLGGILAAVLLQSHDVAEGLQRWLSQFIPCPDLHLVAAAEWVEHLGRGEIFPLWGGAIMILMSVLSLVLTPRTLRRANDFTWEAILEVAVLFVGIFITMVPALALLAKHSDELGLTQAWQYFWLTGGLSSFLDNAPTYLTFATIASQGQNLGAFAMVNGQPNLLLQAISCGAVFMGANTYIGNGPNFMVKAIAETSGYRTPTFFGYMGYSCLVLLPIFVVVTLIFF